uniref:Uncharacterized protein n=1 Tax=virus sp. ctd0M1 TaxID=2827993 RepID=A0A8S5RDK5_9VIRU|nr:MAG TPA: hypothetical protein [virus sp. ctd0M1]
MRLNPFNNTVDKRIIRALEDLATENYSNPFGELARVKIKAKELLKQLKVKEVKKNAHIQQS